MKGALTPGLTPVLPWISTSWKAGMTLVMDEKPYTKALYVLEKLNGIIKNHETLVTDNSGIKRHHCVRWKQDIKDLCDLNQHILGIAAQTVSSIIMPASQAMASRPREETGDIEKIAWDLLAEARPTRTTETWGMAARGQAKAFGKLLSLLPDKVIAN